MSDQNYQDPYAQQSANPPAQQWGQPAAAGSDPYAQPASYGQSAYGQPATQEYPQAQTVFIMGIVGIFVGICSFIAWYMGGKAKKEIAAGAPYKWEGNIKTGYILGKVFGIITIVVTVLYIVLAIVGGIIAAGQN